MQLQFPKIHEYGSIIKIRYIRRDFNTIRTRFAQNYIGFTKVELPRQTAHVHKCLHEIQRVALYMSKELKEYICALLSH